MLPASAGESSEGQTAADNQTVRNVFVIGPDKLGSVDVQDSRGCPDVIRAPLRRSDGRDGSEAVCGRRCGSGEGGGPAARRGDGPGGDGQGQPAGPGGGAVAGAGRGALARTAGGGRRP